MATKVFLDGEEVFGRTVTITAGQLISVVNTPVNPVGNAVLTDNVVTVDGTVVPGGIVTVRGFSVTVDVPDTGVVVADQTDTMSPTEEHVIEAQVVDDETMQ